MLISLSKVIRTKKIAALNGARSASVCSRTTNSRSAVGSANFGPSNMTAALSRRQMSNEPPKKLEVFINDQKVLVDPGTTVMQAAKLAGVHIPRFCYHEKLSIAGSCRMCLVEVEKMPKPVAACAMPVNNGWRVKTDSDLAKKAREGIMEFLLINHPLDCPVCDQGGECDLQDQSMSYGSDRSRFTENTFTGKRAVADKDIGPLVKTIMNRCIQCTRCVRFAHEIAGADELGTTGRGNDLQIGTYVTRPIVSELSGNLIDVCPVGALTSKPAEFTYRSWELKRIPSIDLSDAVGSNILVGFRAGKVLKITPQPNEEINEDWISDKARFSLDGLKVQRLLTPMARDNIITDQANAPFNNLPVYTSDTTESNFSKISWESALLVVGQNWNLNFNLKTVTNDQLNEDNFFALIGPECDVESMVALKDLFNLYNSENVYIYDQQLPNLKTGTDFRSTYLMNQSIQDIERADTLLLVGSCPRYEAALINARIRKAWMNSGLAVGVIGKDIDTNYPATTLGDNIRSLENLLSQIKSGKHESDFVKRLASSKKPMVLLGSSIASKGELGSRIHSLVMELCTELNRLSGASESDWNSFNYLQRSSGYAGALDIGIKVFDEKALAKLKRAKFIYNMGCDSLPVQNLMNLPNSPFVVYQGIIGDKGADNAHVILPGCTYFEKSVTYVNTEGRVQMTTNVSGPSENTNEDWKIIRALSEIIGHDLPYNDYDQLKKRIRDIAPHLVDQDPMTIQSNSFFDLAKQFSTSKPTSSSSIIEQENAMLEPAVKTLEEFYLTDVVCRNSKTMADCVTALRKWNQSQKSKPEAAIANH